MGLSVGSVDSVANLGWGRGTRIVRQSFTRNSRQNQKLFPPSEHFAAVHDLARVPVVYPPYTNTLV